MLISKEKCDQLTEWQMIEKSLQNVDYFTCIYLRYESRLKNYILKISGVSTEEAEDILQEAYLKVWKNLNALDPAMKLSSWLYRIVHNQTVSTWRKNNSNKEQPIVAWGDLTINAFIEEVDELNPELQNQIILKDALNELPSKYKEVVILKYFENMSYEEISDILKIPEGTVAVRLNRAKKEMKKYLEKTNHE